MINIDQAKVLSQILMDYADNNLNNWESYGDKTPPLAKEIYDKAKALNDLLNKEKD